VPSKGWYDKHQHSDSCPEDQNFVPQIKADTKKWEGQERDQRPQIDDSTFGSHVFAKRPPKQSKQYIK